MYRLVLTILLLLTLPTLGFTAFIDDFVVPQLAVASLANSRATSVSIIDSTILGGERDIIVRNVSETEPEPNFYEARAAVSNGLAVLSTDFGVAARFTVIWDGIDGDASITNPLGLGGVDLSHAGGFKFRIHSDHAINRGLEVIFTSGTIGSVSASERYVNLIANASGQFTDYSLSFASFSPLIKPYTTGNPADPSSIGSITIRIMSHGKTELDAALFPVQAIPEASSVLHLLIGVIFFAIIIYIQRRIQ